jgi:hypothetical protein
MRALSQRRRTGLLVLPIDPSRDDAGRAVLRGDLEPRGQRYCAALSLGVINEYEGGGGDPPAATTGAVVTTTWTKVNALLTPQDAGVSITFDLKANVPQGHCYVVDDALAYKVR